jgi:hypothetical protein
LKLPFPFFSPPSHVALAFLVGIDALSRRW